MSIYEELEQHTPDHLRRRPIMFLTSYKGHTYAVEWLSPGRWHVWEPEYLVIPPPDELYSTEHAMPQYFISHIPEGDIPGKRPDGKVYNWCHYGRTPTITGHYTCGDCGHSVHPTGCVPPLGWVMCDTYWLCPICADRRRQGNE